MVDWVTRERTKKKMPKIFLFMLTSPHSCRGARCMQKRTCEVIKFYDHMREIRVRVDLKLSVYYASLCLFRKKKNICNLYYVSIYWYVLYCLWTIKFRAIDFAENDFNWTILLHQCRLCATSRRFIFDFFFILSKYW